DPQAPKAYPIATYTWMLFYKENKDPKKAAALRQMVEYCLTEGQKMSASMGYIPLPETVVAAVRKAAASIQCDDLARTPARSNSEDGRFRHRHRLEFGLEAAVDLGLFRRPGVPTACHDRRVADPVPPRLHPLVHREQGVGGHARFRARVPH